MCSWERLDVADGLRICNAEATASGFCALHEHDREAEARLTAIANAEREVLLWMRRDVVCELENCIAYWHERLHLLSGPGREHAAAILAGSCPAHLRYAAPATPSAAIAVLDLLAALRPNQRITLRGAA